MMKMKRKLLSLFLALVLCLGVTSQAALAAEPGAQPVYQAMIALKDQYPEGMHWTNDNFYAWKGGIYSGGYGCAGFAFLLSDAAFGDLPGRLLTEFSLADVRVGDILRVNGDTHSVIVLEVFDDHVVIAEGNYNSSIHWGRTLTAQEVEAADYVLTRYPEAEEIPLSGAWGDGVSWSFDPDSGVLSFAGTGPMANGAQPEEIPWAGLRDKITAVSVGEGVTSIGGLAFYGCAALASISLPASLASMEPQSFAGCASLSTVSFAGSQSQWDAVAGKEAVGSAAVQCAAATPDPSAPAFVDVAPDAYCAQAVAWAVEQGITTGTGDGSTFSPAKTCTVAEILTFLWRANGAPEASRFSLSSSIAPGSYYYDAALWAGDKGLIAEVGFAEAEPCTRSMVVTYLWKLAGQPAAGTAAFSDVPAEADYAQAVAWAVEQGITTGAGDGSTFSPGNTCTRGEIVTFLYRNYAQ